MDTVWDILQSVFCWFAFAAAAVLVLVGFVLSVLSISGTWLVLGAAALLAVAHPGPFPGWGTILGFLLFCVAVEVVEALAGAWGVRRRGGSGWAGAAAVVGGLVGLWLGTFIPIPLVGSLLGMAVGGFVLVFIVEKHRLKHAGQAADIAWGSVIARIAVIVVKVGVTVGMTVYLVLGFLGVSAPA